MRQSSVSGLVHGLFSGAKPHGKFLITFPLAPGLQNLSLIRRKLRHSLGKGAAYFVSMGFSCRIYARRRNPFFLRFAAFIIKGDRCIECNLFVGLFLSRSKPLSCFQSNLWGNSILLEEIRALNFLSLRSKPLNSFA